MANAFFDGDHLEDMARQALEFERLGAQGVYFVPNPLRSDATGSRRAAKDEDVVCRRWLLIDVDPVRLGTDGRPLEDAKVSATGAERARAWAVLDRCLGTMRASGFAEPVVGDSGNGWHLCYPVDLPNDEQSKQAVRELLRGLQKRCGDEYAAVDTSTFNAARIWKLYGTLSRKGAETPERPHRRSRLVELGSSRSAA